MEYWQKDADLKILVAVWERGDQAGNTALTVAVLQTYATLLSISTRSSTGFAAIGSPYQGTLAKFVSSLVGLLHYVKPYLHQQGKNELATAALDMLNALLHLIRMSSARNATARKVWVSLNLDSKVICRLLGTKRKVPLITKHGRRAGLFTLSQAECFRQRTDTDRNLFRHTTPHAGLSQLVLLPNNVCYDSDRHFFNEGSNLLHLEESVGRSYRGN